MIFNPRKHTIDMFEPGSIKCSLCENKPDDAWDTSPEGFFWVEYIGGGQWECDECVQNEPPPKGAA